MHKIALNISAALLLMTAMSCQEQLIERRAEGMIAVRLENSRKVEIVTKAQWPEVSPDNFNVYVASERETVKYVYSEMQGGVTVVSGIYTVSADNVTEEEALKMPDQWGQARYYGISARKEVKVGATTEFNLTCRMVNSAASVIFDPTVAEHFTRYEVTLYTDEGRKLVFDSANTTGENPAIAFFSTETLNYVFTGILAEGGKTITSNGTSKLAPATHLKLTFQVPESNGSIGLDITVDTTYEIVSEYVPVDPEATE